MDFDENQCKGSLWNRSNKKKRKTNIFVSSKCFELIVFFNSSTFYFQPIEQLLFFLSHFEWAAIFHKHKFPFICRPWGRIQSPGNKISFIGYAPITKFLLCKKNNEKYRKRKFYTYTWFLDIVLSKVDPLAFEVKWEEWFGIDIDWRLVIG